MILNIATQMPPIEFPINPFGVAAAVGAAGLAIAMLINWVRAAAPPNSRRKHRHR